MEPKEEKRLSKLLTSGPPIKKMILLSISIFSFVFSYYSLCSSSLQFHSRKFPCLSSNPSINLQSHAVNKSYVFLICNALLVFLSKTSGLLRSSSGFDPNHLSQRRVVDGLLTYDSFETKEEEEEDDDDHETITPNEERKEITAEVNDDYYKFEPDGDITVLLHGKESENCLLVEEDEFMYQQDQEEAMSTEELNKKFEEFIRKTKEEIMVNEARELVIVK